MEKENSKGGRPDTLDHNHEALRSTRSPYLLWKEGEQTIFSPKEKGKKWSDE